MVLGKRPFGFSRLTSIAAVALVAITVRLVPLARPGTAWMLQHDSPSYIMLAKGLTKGCGVAPWKDGTCGTLEMGRTPGYPLFLAVIPSLRFVVVVQAILEAVTVFVVGVAAAAVAGTFSGIVAASIFAFDVVSISNCATIMTEPLFTAIVALAFGLQIVAVFRFADTKTRLIVSFVAAVLIGVSALVRPIGVVLIVTAPLLLLPLQHSKLRSIWIAIVLTMIAAAPTLAWSLRNFEDRGVFSLSLTPLYNLYFYRAASLLAHEKGIQEDQQRALLLRELPKVCSPVFTDSPPACFEVLKRRAFQIIRKHPAELAAIMVRGTAVLMFGPGLEATREMLGEGATEAAKPRPAGKAVFALVIFEFMLLAVTWTGMVFTIVKFGLPWRWSHYPLLLPFAAALLLILATAGPEAYSRYRIPVMPLLAIISGIGWGQIFRPHLSVSECQADLALKREILHEIRCMGVTVLWSDGKTQLEEKQI